MKLIASSQSLTALYANLYPPDGSMPRDNDLRLFRKNPDARSQLLLSLMIQLAQSQEQNAKLIAALAINLKQATQGGGVAAAQDDSAGAAPPVAQAEAAGDGIDYDAPLPAVSATVSAFVPAARPMAGPMTTAVAPAPAPMAPATVSAPPAVQS